MGLLMVNIFSSHVQNNHCVLMTIHLKEKACFFLVMVQI